MDGSALRQWICACQHTTHPLWQATPRDGRDGGAILTPPDMVIEAPESRVCEIDEQTRSAAARQPIWLSARHCIADGRIGQGHQGLPKLRVWRRYPQKHPQIGWLPTDTPGPHWPGASSISNAFRSFLDLPGRVNGAQERTRTSTAFTTGT